MPSARIATAAILILTCMLATASGQEAAAESVEQPAFEKRRFRFIDHAVSSGPIGMAGLYAIALAFGLIAVAPYLIGGRRKRMYVLLGTAACLGTGGYLMFDWTYISQDLSLRDAQEVRDDCEELLKLHAATLETQSVGIPANNLPASFAGLGATYAKVSDGQVEICVWLSCDGCLRGYLYDPKALHTRWQRPLRASWHRDFYLYPEF